MLVKLLKDVEQGGRMKVNRRNVSQLQQVVQLVQDGLIKDELAKPLIDQAAKRVIEVPFVKDAVIDMSEASAAKYIAAGLAEAYVEPSQPAQ